MSESTYEPGTYVKGDSKRVANTASQAVALAFEGYKREGSTSEADTAATAPAPVTSTAAVPTATPVPRAPRPADSTEKQKDTQS